ncbi:aldehyde dehydrogenase family protein [Pigmentiphaga litoralis]|uniref:Aldehyde dehydrogenase (NAD+) n=1 Tax=Pigmentiphaga litoralis TaxID=516702 RepID=A0A7Y9IVF9_9BURK|nr:aldehyde dehydrogenase family protein [Pigmentiphaga litoralis]NYE23157.1 aldehyde dehydrogenase (NAD+) [Pigmentiphaga litoralis]NYE83228.1 aldehyde dehydrogenase (NAD+) [Pigmentiphaga litoralis]
MTHYDRFYIDGSWVAPQGTRTFELVNPATEQPYGDVTLGTQEDVDRAVNAARKAFRTFSKTSPAQRIEMLERILSAMEQRQDDLMAAVTLEMGAPSSLKGQVGTAIQAFRQAVLTLRDYSFETRMGDNIVRREPIGVCGLISAWNWPLQLLCTKLGSAFAAGCTVVVKPSEFTPVSALLLAEVMDAAGVPPGVFNLVNGDGPVVGEAISRHRGIDMVSFTGSTRAGIMVAQAAALTVKRVCQELGGKSANIILPDGDLAAAARFNVSRGFSNTGQSCHSPTRMLVAQDQLDQFLELVTAEAAKVRVGDPGDPATTIGPVVNRAQFERVQAYIAKGIEEGARVVCGGLGRPEGLEHGYFIKPTVFADVRPDMTIAQEEIFGPVLVVLTYRDVDDAIEIANDTCYGLGGYLFSADASKARAVAEELRTGRIFYNGAPSNTVAPMGGYKQSGNGREMGVFGLEEYLEVKAMIGFLDKE